MESRSVQFRLNGNYSYEALDCNDAAVVLLETRCIIGSDNYVKLLGVSAVEADCNTSE